MRLAGQIHQGAFGLTFDQRGMVRKKKKAEPFLALPFHWEHPNFIWLL